MKPSPVILDRLRHTCLACGQVLFLDNLTAGAVVLAITWLRPGMAVAAIVSVLAAWAVAWLAGFEKEFSAARYYAFNPFLVGLSLGARFEFSAPLVLLVVAAGSLTFVVTHILAHLLVTRSRLPVLSLPFALVSVVAYLAATRFPSALRPITDLSAVMTWDLGLPPVVVGFFKSLGAVMFVPCVVGGACLAAMIFRASRILFALAVGGYALGLAVRTLLFGSLAQALADGSNFNSILIAMGLGGVFLVPSLRSALVASAAIVAGLVVLEAITVLPEAYGTPPFTLPFCIVAIVTVYALRLGHSPLLSPGIGRMPEEVRENWLVNRRRYVGDWRTLNLPFSGRWTVWQAFNGRWTHRGIWRYAYDFVITDDEGHTHRGVGDQLADYYCYRLPVLSPVSGRVVRVVDKLIDNPVGTVAGSAGGGSNWGNFVLLYDPRGFYVEVSHFSLGTIRVAEGAWVERGAVLGLCGNSGNSPQPHIHVQVQATDALASATLPFSFVSYLHNDRHHANDLPPEGDVVEPLHLDSALDESTSFVVDDVHSFEVRQCGRRAGTLRMKVAIAIDGTYCFETDLGRLYFGKYEGTSYSYRCEGSDPYLWAMLVALPRLPLVRKPGLVWHDYVPASLVLNGWRRWLAQGLSFVWPKLGTISVRQSFRGDDVESVLESPLLAAPIRAYVELDATSGFAYVRVGDLELMRQNTLTEQAPRSMRTARRNRRSKIIVACAVAVVLVTAVGVGAVNNVKRQEDVNAAVAQSRALEVAANYTDAIEVLLDQQRTHAKNYTLNLRLGWLYYLAGRYDESERYYLAARASAPMSLEARLGNMLPLLALGRYRDTEALAREVLAKDQGNYYANLRLVIALRLQQKYDEADKVVSQMLKAYPSDATFLAERAWLRPTLAGEIATSSRAAAEAKVQEAVQVSLQRELEQNLPDAIDVLAKAYELHKDNYVLNLRLGWLNYLSGKYFDAVRYYQMAQRLSPVSREAKLGHLLVLLADGKYAEVKPIADKILVGDPGNYLANLRLVVALRLDGKFLDAQKIVDRMLRSYPCDVSFLTEAALLKVGQKDLPAAKKLLADVLALDPDNATAKAQLATLAPAAS